MSTRTLRSQLTAIVGAGLLTATVTMYGSFATIDRTTAPALTQVPVRLAAYGTDAANAVANAASDSASTMSSYLSFFDDLPSLPVLPVGLNIPGVFDGFDNMTGVLPWDYAFGLTLGNTGGFGVQAWDPSNPIFTLVAESLGTNYGQWPGVASLVGVETMLGGFTNTESYANFYDPTGTTCLICDTFTLLGPLNTDLFSWTTDIPIGGLPEFELTTALGSIGADLGNAFNQTPFIDAPPALSGLVSDPVSAVSSLAGDPAALVNDLASTLGPAVSADLSALLTTVGADAGANLGADLSALIPQLLTSLIP